MGSSHPPSSPQPKPISLESNGSQPPAGVREVSISLLVLFQNQPRRYFDAEAMQQLAASIKENGILQPLVVRPVGDKYEVVAGERRYRAALEVGLNSVPVTVCQMTDEQALQYGLVENLQREDLNPVEETDATLKLLALKLNYGVDEVKSLLYRMQKEVKGKRVAHNVMGQPEAEIVKSVFDGIGRMSWDSFVNNRLPILNLPPEVLEAVRKGQIEYTKAKAIARVKDGTARGELLAGAIGQKWSLSEIKTRIGQYRAGRKEVPSLKNQLQSAYTEMRKSKVWDDPDKREQLEDLLVQMRAMLSKKGGEGGNF